MQKGWIIGQRDAGAKPSDVAKNLQKTFGIRREKRQINRVLKRARKNPEWLSKRAEVSGRPRAELRGAELRTGQDRPGQARPSQARQARPGQARPGQARPSRAGQSWLENR